MRSRVRWDLCDIYLITKRCFCELGQVYAGTLVHLFLSIWILVIWRRIFFSFHSIFIMFSSSFLTRQDKGQRPIVAGVSAWHVQRHVESLLAGAAHFLGKSYASVRRSRDGSLPSGESVYLLKQEVIKEQFYNLIHSPWAVHQSMKWSRLTINITSFNHTAVEVRW